MTLGRLSYASHDCQDNSDNQNRSDDPQPDSDPSRDYKATMEECLAEFAGVFQRIAIERRQYVTINSSHPYRFMTLQRKVSAAVSFQASSTLPSGSTARHE